MNTPPPPTAPKARRRALKTQLDVRRALAALYASLEGGSIDVARARVMVYTLATLSAVHERTELEARLATLEERLAGSEPKP